MTNSIPRYSVDDADGLDGLPMPLDAVVLPSGDGLLDDPSPPGSYGSPANSEERWLRRKALAALLQAIADWQLNLPLGPRLDVDDPRRLLSLNQRAVQLALCGFTSDRVSFDARPWQQEATAPQLLLLAAIEADQRVVHFPGVLTAEEVVAVLAASPAEGLLELPVTAFRGGLERLFILLVLLNVDVLPRRALLPSVSTPPFARVLDWLQGELTPSFADLGATLLPAGARAFREAAASGLALPPGTRAVVALPLGLSLEGNLCNGQTAANCLERFRLLLIPVGLDAQSEAIAEEQLLLRLEGDPAGDLLPDNLVITVLQGNRRQSFTTAGCTELSLPLRADASLVTISLEAPGGALLQLPSLQLLPD